MTDTSESRMAVFNNFVEDSLRLSGWNKTRTASNTNKVNDQKKFPSDHLKIEKIAMKSDQATDTMGLQAMTLEDYAKRIEAPDAEERFNAVQEIRRYLSASENPPINDAISSNIVPILIKYLDDDDR